MQKQAFIEERKEFEQRFKRNDWIYSAVLIAVLFANYLVVGIWDFISEDWTWTYLIAFFAFLFGNIFLLGKFHSYQIKNSGLYCISCLEPLLAAQADIAIATDNCPMCGGAAFEADT